MGDKLMAERWAYIAKLEADNLERKIERDKIARENEIRMQHAANISNAVVIAMSVFNPFILLGSSSKDKDK